MNKNILLLIIILSIGSYSNNFLNQKSEELDLEVNKKKKIILDLRKKIKIEKTEFNYLINPERIQKLANKHLKKDYIIYEKKNIKKIY
ncbi:MAG: hypothetical protein CMI81_04175 [Candidatus Pelagibacter sp.]|nr:hypothetical protein [Candidatus Pelagibacter sp.]OUV96300.1 MAG: hypothetical protein CBD02_05200 [Candidatus Pelagibacter sp. TMED142]